MRKIFLLGFLFCSAVWGAAVSFEQLTPEEKLAQTLVVFVDVDSAELVRPVIESGQIGGVLLQWGNYSLEETKRLIDKLQSWAQKSPHKVPLLVAVDYEGGTVYTPITLGFDYLPTNMMLAASKDEQGVASLAYLAGQELKRVGVHINFSPVLDVNNNPNNPIIGVRSFGSDPENVTKMGLALIDGFKASGIVPMVKHFPGHGDTSVDSHYTVPVVRADKEQLYKIHLHPFREAVRRQVEGIMTGHVLYPALDAENIATFSKPILQDLLRGKMGFNGLIVTDSLDMKGATSYCTISGCAVRSLASGADLILLGRYIKPLKVFTEIYQDVQEKQLTARVEESARRVFSFKQRLGLFDNKKETVPPTGKAYQKQLTKISNQAVTLVRNSAQLIPFQSLPTNKKKPTVCSIFFAPSRFADQLLGFSQPFLEKGWKVRSYNAAFTPQNTDIQRAEQCAKGADLVVIGSLQWADKTNSNQKNVISQLLKEHKNTVLLSTMSPYDIVHYPQASTVLATYGINKYVLQAAAQVILGQLQPKGTLPVQLSGIKTAASGDLPTPHTTQAKQTAQ